jgi:hypothetical protein
MIVDRNAAMPVPAGTTPGKGGTAAQPSGQDRTAWLKEMEKQEMTAWLSHPATLPARAAAPAAAVYARLSPPAMPADTPASADAQDAGVAPGSHRQLPPADAGARADERESAAPDEADTAAAGDGKRQRDRSEQAPDGVTAAAPGVAAVAHAPGPAVSTPANLVAAVMSALVQEGGAGGGMQAAQAAAQSVPVPNGAGSAAPEPPAAALVRPLAMPVQGGMQGPLPVGPRSEPAAQESESGEVQGRRASAAAQGGTPGEAPAPLRIHTVSTASGVRVWIGADQAVGLSGQQLLLAAIEIRRLLKDQGTPLASLIYNGESVFEDEGMPDASAPRTAAASGAGPRKHIKT